MVLGVQTPMIAAVPAWRLSKLTLECAIEGRFRFVSDVGGDFRNASRCHFEYSRGRLKPPAGQVSHGRLGKIAGKALDESGPRNAHLIREISDCPRMDDAAMQQARLFRRWDRACLRAIPFVVPASWQHSAATYQRTRLPR